MAEKSARVAKALEYHKKGYNCAQAVACAYADLFGVDEKTAFRMTEGFGFGMGAMGTCGAVSGMTFIAGLKNSDGNLDAPATKKGTYKCWIWVGADGDATYAPEDKYIQVTVKVVK